MSDFAPCGSTFRKCLCRLSSPTFLRTYELSLRACPVTDPLRTFTASVVGLRIPPNLGYNADVLIADTTLRAGVLIPLIEARDGSDFHIVLTVRAHHMRVASGDVVFPGGRMEPEHDTDIIQTALRETKEEVFLPSSSVLVLTTLPNYLARAGVIVTPVVGFVHDTEWKRRVWEEPSTLANRSEVHEVFTYPLRKFLQDGPHHFSFEFTFEHSEIGPIATRFHRFRHPKDTSTRPLERPKPLPKNVYPPYPTVMGFSAHAAITCAEIAYGRKADFLVDMEGGMTEAERLRKMGEVLGTWRVKDEFRDTVNSDSIGKAQGVTNERVSSL